MNALDSNLDPRLRRPKPLLQRGAVRTGIGLVLAPVVGGALFMVILVVLMVAGDGAGGSMGLLQRIFGAAFMGAIYGGLVGLPYSLTIGGLGHHFLSRRGLDSVLPYVGLFAMTGMCSVLVPWLFRLAFTPHGSFSEILGFWSGLVTTAVAGAFGGIAFWRIRRPDRD
ncbi:MAG: hypothetical protein P1V35_17870 [Planctomycetota bacterium]|nr:hypothetical protein [Planctomycetota bacterium]